MRLISLPKGTLVKNEQVCKDEHTGGHGYSGDESVTTFDFSSIHINPRNVVSIDEMVKTFKGYGTHKDGGYRYGISIWNYLRIVMQNGVQYWVPNMTCKQFDDLITQRQDDEESV